MKCLIVSGGAVEEGFLSGLVKIGGFDVILAADAGMESLYRDHISPDIIVGDFDSVNPDTLEYFREKEQIEICMLNPEKNDTDTEYAIREAIRRGALEIVVIGATGSRLDHVLGNVCLLGIGLEQHVDICLMDQNNRIRMIDAPLCLKKKEQYGTYVSLLPFSEQVSHVTLRGFKYPLNDYTMGGFNSLGISNEIVEDEAEISFSGGKLLVIESKD